MACGKIVEKSERKTVHLQKGVNNEINETTEADI